MPRKSHGYTITLESLEAGIEALNDLNESLGSPVALATPRRQSAFGYMFPGLQNDPANLLPEGDDVIANLILLGDSMRDTNPESNDNSFIPAAYTYLGQFIDHDITLEVLSEQFGKLEDAYVPDSAEKVLQRVLNERTANLELDSVYEWPAPYDGEKMKLGPVSQTNRPIPGKDKDNDLPRSPSLTPEELADPDKAIYDRFALIGDARNDENLVVAQLHLAFLRAHNALVDRLGSFNRARRVLTQLYQWVVLTDFLNRIVHPSIVGQVRQANRFFDPGPADFFMPLEFTVAAYRYGHSMVRESYDFNQNFSPTDFLDLFTFTALSGQLGNFETLPDSWIIQWERFVDDTPNPARKIDTRMVDPLYKLRKVNGAPHQGVRANLAARNLLRGYKLRMPTGQAVAAAMGVNPLNNASLRDLIAANAARAGLTPEQQVRLATAGFDSGTPLWFYILAESELEQDGERLGVVGGTIVAEVLIGLARRSDHSIFDLGEGWTPAQLSGELEQDINPEFTLKDLLRLGGVLS